MPTLVVGLGPAGRGLLSALHAGGTVEEVCRDGLVVVEPGLHPGGGSLGSYAVRSDSAAAVFATCVEDVAGEPELARSAALAEMRAVPDGQSIRLGVVGELLRDATPPLVRRTAALGADVRLGTRVAGVVADGSRLLVRTITGDPAVPGGGAAARDVVGDARPGREEVIEVDQVVMAVGGTPYIPVAVGALPTAALAHSDLLLRSAGLAAVLRDLPGDPRIVIVGRAHSAFSVADRLLSTPPSAAWSPGAVTVATRGRVRVTYPDAAAATADGAVFTSDDVCPQSGRVWRLCGLRGDAAARFRLARDGADPRLVVRTVTGPHLARLAGEADLVVAATGYRSAALDLVDGAAEVAQGQVRSRSGQVIPGVWSLGLGSGSRREPGIGEPSYDGPLDGVWHYQHNVAPRLLDLMPSPRRSHL